MYSFLTDVIYPFTQDTLTASKTPLISLQFCASPGFMLKIHADDGSLNGSFCYIKRD